MKCLKNKNLIKTGLSSALPSYTGIRPDGWGEVLKSNYTSKPMRHVLCWDTAWTYCILNLFSFNSFPVLFSKIYNLVLIILLCLYFSLPYISVSLYFSVPWSRLQASEQDILKYVVKWGEQQLIKRMADRGKIIHSIITLWAAPLMALRKLPTYRASKIHLKALQKGTKLYPKKRKWPHSDWSCHCVRWLSKQLSYVGFMVRVISDHIVWTSNLL